MGRCFNLAPGEAWSDAINADLGCLAAAKRLEWSALFKHTLTATSARPTAKWLASGGKIVQGIGTDLVREALLRWLPLVAPGQTIPKLAAYPGDTRGTGDVMNEENATCLRGLLWLVQTIPRPHDLVRMISSTALSAYKKVPGIGPRAVKVGNAAVYALSEMKSAEAVAQLAMLKVRVKFGTAQKEIEKAFTTAAQALGQEVQDFNRKRDERVFRGLVQPIDAERTSNGKPTEFRLKAHRPIEWKAQFEKAIEAFDRNGFFILIDDKQAESLDQEFVIGHTTQVSFVRLTLLVGG